MKVVDHLPCALPFSELLHACELFGAPALCRPQGPEPAWVSRWPWAAFGDTDMCPLCRELMQAASELDDVEQQVARW